jgi:hypothetical protein
MAKHVLPVPAYCVKTQTFARHIQRAKENGWCWQPGPCASGTYYYGGLDLAPTWADINRDIPVAASAEFKKIEYADWDRKGKGPGGGYGIYVKGITPDGEEVIFAHLVTMPLVKPGEKYVPQNTQLGWMGSTGNSSGKHTHWEIRVDGIPVDPETKLGAPVIKPPDKPPIVIPPAEFSGAAILDLTGEQLQVITDYVNKRSGPGTSLRGYNVIGRLEHEQVVTGKRLILYDAWIDLGDGYCAWVYQGIVYLVKK